MGNSVRDIISLRGVFLSPPYVVTMPQTFFQLSRRDLESKRRMEGSLTDRWKAWAMVTLYVYNDFFFNNPRLIRNPAQRSTAMVNRLFEKKIM